MYEENDAFEKPLNKDAKIWRFTDFPKFVSMIDEKKLFFVRVDKLQDKFEGTLSYADTKREEEIYNKHNLETPKHQCNWKLRKASKKWMVVNSWHINEYESAAMWKLHSRDGEGIAIQSTFNNLTKCFRTYAENPVFVGVVKYIDYERDEIPWRNFLYPFMYKRKSFEHEHELRAAIFKFPQIIKKGTYESLDLKDEPLGAMGVPVDLDILIQAVYLSPTSEDWIADLVKSTMDKYGLKKKLFKSSLKDKPLY